MPEQAQDPILVALQAVHAALKNLNPDSRKKVISSVALLLEIPSSENSPEVGTKTFPPKRDGEKTPAARPLSLIELMQEKKPSANPQRIALFAYYREKHEGNPKFSRSDLETYFSKAKEPPARNYGRDFAEAVKKGWIHEDGADSYLTSKGLEAVESGFPSERSHEAPRAQKRRKASSTRSPRKKR